MARFMEARSHQLFDRLADASVTIGAVTAKGIKDIVGVEDLEGETAGLEDDMVSVVVEVGVFPGLTTGVAAAVDGVACLVQSARPIEDGALIRLVCTLP